MTSAVSPVALTPTHIAPLLHNSLKAVVYFDIRITDENLTQDKLVEEMGTFDDYVQMDEKAIEMEKPTTTAAAAEVSVGGTPN